MLKMFRMGSTPQAMDREKLRKYFRKFRPAHIATARPRNGRNGRRFPRYARAHRHGWQGYFWNQRQEKIRGLFRRMKKILTGKRARAARV
jgi:hypothetical protein